MKINWFGAFQVLEMSSIEPEMKGEILRKEGRGTRRADIVHR